MFSVDLNNVFCSSPAAPVGGQILLGLNPSANCFVYEQIGISILSHYGHVAPTELADVLLQGCSIAEILKMKQRTVKAHIHRLFMRFGIKHGVKRV